MNLAKSKAGKASWLARQKKYKGADMKKIAPKGARAAAKKLGRDKKGRFYRKK